MIKLENLRAGYPGNEILRAADLVIPDNSLTIVIGPNGSGKSTLLKTMAGILPKAGGNVLIDTEALLQKKDARQPAAGRNREPIPQPRSQTGSGTISAASRVPEGLCPFSEGSHSLEDIDRLTNESRARLISCLPQNRNTPEITAFRMVLHGRFPYLGWPRRYRKSDEAAAERAMRKADCWELRDRRMPDLSGGERQKIYIAMILAQDTPNILLDEPTTWLDIGHQLNLMRTAKSLAAEHRAVVMVLHDLGLAMRFADHLILVAERKTTPLMKPEELFESRLADKAFGVTLSRFLTDDGWQYYCR